MTTSSRHSWHADILQISIELVLRDGLPLEQVAQICEIRPDTARKRLQRARDRLRKILQKSSREHTLC
ncbi:sigma factor-like helix-turn-helix DNA-binding protein [Arcanobacterium haemolyticum]|uniref:sigma factor-like helix-turn-helix DNA-binding protein n=1 Tax=Arcanobacterium haemolyticum TaxID=28264 RepID=UPI0037BE8567